MRVKTDRYDNEFSIFFFDSLIHVFQSPSKKLWAFVVYFNREIEEISINSCDPRYASEEVALRAGKLRALENFVLRSQEILYLTLYPNDRISMQSDEAIKLFGRAKNMEAASFYPNRQDRVDFLQKVALEGTTSSPVKMINLDGGQIDGTLTSRLIRIDPDTAFLLEEFELRSVAL